MTISHERSIAFALLIAVILASSTFAAETEKPVSFKNDVAPILAKNCLTCHGPADPNGEYQLHNFESLMRHGQSEEPPITAGDVQHSYLLTLVRSDDEGERMPKEAEALPTKDVETIRRWIAEGAKFDGPDKQAELTTYLPRRIHPRAPKQYHTTLPVTALAFSEDGEELAVSGYHEITVWNTDDGSLVRRIGNVDERVYSLEYQPHGHLLAAATGTPGQSGEAALYDPQKGKLARVLVTVPDVMLNVTFSPDGTTLATAGSDRKIYLFNVASGKRQNVIEVHADWVLGLAWNHAGTRLASAGRDKVAKTFDVASGETLATFVQHEDPVFAVAFSSDDKLVFSSGADKRIRAWREHDAKEQATTKSHGDILKLLVAGNRLFVAGSNKTIHELKADELKNELRAFKGHDDFVFALAMDEKRKLLASGSFDGEVRIWNMKDGKLVKSFHLTQAINDRK